MKLNKLIYQGWDIREEFHSEECYIYYSAVKGRNILTSKDGQEFHGLLNGRWI